MSQTPSTARVTAHHHKGSVLRLTQSVGSTTVHGISDTIIRVRVSSRSESGEVPSYAIEGPVPSRALAVSRSAEFIDAQTDACGVRIGTDELSLSFTDGNGALLSAGLPIHFGADTLSDTRVPQPDEDFFGLGERITPLGRRGYTVVNWNTDNPHYQHEQRRSMYSSFPFYVALDRSTGRCYGYFHDSPWKSSFDMCDTLPDRVQIEAWGGELNIYFFSAPTLAGILRDYTMLTGRHAMAPVWALGYHQCRWSYMSTADARQIVQEFRARKIPLDALWFDIDYMDSFRVFTFDATRFGDMRECCRDLDDAGVRRVAIVDPGVKVDPAGVYDVHDEGCAKGYFAKDAQGNDYVGKVWPGGTKFPDFSRPDVRAWWGQLHKRYYDMGIDAFWNDMNEPADMAPPGDKTVPLDVRMDDGGRHTTMEKLHNVYALFEAMATVQDGMLALRPDARPFLLTRAASAGMQKYSAKWGGDNVSSWGHLEASIPQLLNMGLSGLGFFGADVGGFGANAQPELLARWTQLGTFYPFFRNHCSTGQIHQEPWSFGPEIERACREAIELRYHLLPYFYQLFREMHTSGAPMVRPLFWHFQHDARTYGLVDQFMLGADIVVAPVTRRGAESRAVYLPEGTWYHYLTGRKFAGGCEYVVSAPLNSIPVFVRAGSVTPVMPVVASTRYIDRSVLTLEVFPGEGDFSAQLYEDDTESNAYQRGEFCFNTVTYSHGRLHVALDKASGVRIVVVRVFGDGASWREQRFEDVREVSVGV